MQDGDGFLSAEELAAGLEDSDAFANVEDIMQVGPVPTAPLGLQHVRKCAHRSTSATLLPQPGDESPLLPIASHRCAAQDWPDSHELLQRAGDLSAPGGQISLRWWGLPSAS